MLKYLSFLQYRTIVSSSSKRGVIFVNAPGHLTTKRLYSKKNNSGNNKDKQVHSKLENTTSNTIEENENINNNIKDSSYSSTEPDKTDEFHDTVVKTPKDLAQKILKLDRTSNNDTINNDSNYTPFFLKERKKQLILPHVAGNANIPNKDVQIEGLFAGPKPLFLGKSSIISDDNDLTPNYHTITDFFTTLEKIGEEDNDANNNNSTRSSTDIGEVINAYRNKKKNSRKPIIPWEASISGLIYNDKPFRTIPKSLISKLKPFKLINLEKKNTKDSPNKDNSTVKFKVHNSFVNDEVEMVNLFDISDDFSDDPSNSKSDAKKNSPFSKSTLITDANLAKEWYYKEKMRYAEDYKFIKADQYVFKTYVTKLNKFLAKEFYKQTKLTINNQFRDHLLPLYIYVDKSICSKNRFQSYLRKKIIDNIEPILDTVCASYEDRKQAEAFHARVMIKVNAIIKELSIYLPSVYFTGDTIDCILNKSPVKGFGRIHWLKPKKRYNWLFGKNTERNYVFDYNQEYNMTRSGIKYIRYPIKIIWKNFDDAFTEWDYYT